MFNVISNVSRNDTFGTLSSLLELAHGIMSAGWHPASTILVRDAQDGEPDRSVHILRDMIDCASAKNKDGKDIASIRLGEDSMPTGTFLAKLASERSLFYDQTVVSGNRRALACVVLQVFDINVSPIVVNVTGEDTTSLNIRENAQQALAVKVDREARLASVLPAIQAGKITKESELASLGFKRGMCQTLWAQSQLVIGKGASLATAAAVDKETAREIGKLSLTEATAALDGIADREAVKKPSSIPRQKMLELANTAAGNEGVHELLIAIADGETAKASQALLRLLRDGFAGLPTAAEKANE